MVRAVLRSDEEEDVMDMVEVIDRNDENCVADTTTGTPVKEAEAALRSSRSSIIVTAGEESVAKVTKYGSSGNRKIKFYP